MIKMYPVALATFLCCVEASAAKCDPACVGNTYCCGEDECCAVAERNVVNQKRNSTLAGLPRLDAGTTWMNQATPVPPRASAPPQASPPPPPPPAPPASGGPAWVSSNYLSVLVVLAMTLGAGIALLSVGFWSKVRPPTYVIVDCDARASTSCPPPVPSGR